MGGFSDGGKGTLTARGSPGPSHTVSGKRVQDFQQSLEGAPHPQKVKRHWSGAELAPWAKTGLSPKSSLFPQSGLDAFSPPAPFTLQQSLEDLFQVCTLRSSKGCRWGKGRSRLLGARKRWLPGCLLLAIPQLSPHFLLLSPWPTHLLSSDPRATDTPAPPQRPGLTAPIRGLGS